MRGRRSGPRNDCSVPARTGREPDGWRSVLDLAWSFSVQVVQEVDVVRVDVVNASAVGEARHQRLEPSVHETVAG